MMFKILKDEIGLHQAERESLCMVGGQLQIQRVRRGKKKV